MIKIRRSKERGHVDHGWLDTWHTFSFADYYDPQFMGFRQLRVINEDRVQPGKGFGTHSHQEMEIITYVIAGALEHQDSMGNKGVIRPGEVQRMTAGTGVTHSELNHSQSELVHLLQIWILPETPNLPPSYEQKKFPAAERAGKLHLVASREGRAGSVKIHQDVALYAALLDTGQQLLHKILKERHSWIQVVRGQLEVNGQSLTDGDGAEVSQEAELRFAAQSAAEFLFFDLS